MMASAVCLKKPHHIVTLRFIEVVKDHARYVTEVCHQLLPKQLPYILWLLRAHARISGVTILKMTSLKLQALVGESYYFKLVTPVRQGQSIYILCIY